MMARGPEQCLLAPQLPPAEAKWTKWDPQQHRKKEDPWDSVRTQDTKRS